MQLQTILVAVIASSGFWACVQFFLNKNTAQTKLLLGIAHDRIISLGMAYIERGYITEDEYENLVDYLFTPYAESGGNGTAKRVVDEVKKLPITKGHKIVDGK